MSRRTVVVTCSLLVSLASSAHAEADLPAPAVRVDAEVGSPVGVGAVGLVVSHPIVPRFTVEFGAGYGFSGVQASLMAKVPWGRGRLRFMPGVGLSAGFPLGTRTFNRGHPRGDVTKLGRGILMRWLDADLLGVEYRAGGFLFTASAGLSIPLRDAHWDIGDEHGDVSFGSPLPQLRLGAGKSF